MEPERWQKIEQLYHSALEIEGIRRGPFLAIACGGDEALREEVGSLLARAETGDFLETPAMAVAAKAIAGASGKRALPAVIGRYRVVRLLGEGGMGAVYEAEQNQPRRTVALKIIKPGFATLEKLGRFQHEAQTLGRLQHAGIAQIYEAGTADTGFGPQPYFAMELIRGRSLQEYAEAHQLNFRQKLELIAKICDAVDHAHHHGVIHRDLKPANILVDETGQPKILDFGVARVTDSDAQHTRQTELGQLVGTLAYMSPEQVLGDPLALDIRSDVYALGVILYQLFAGKLPYDIDGKPVHEAVRIVREQEPAHLSSINRSYRGDIDTIVAKALEKDKVRRYASAADLAGDIRRYLADEPIAARPASATYQLQKFARRHKALVAGTVAVFLVLAAGAVTSTLEAVRARRAERAADAEAATAEAINNFLQNDLLAQASASNQADPSTKPDPDLKVRTALDRAATRIEGKFAGKPEVEAAIRDTVGQTYVDLGLIPEGRKQLERALELQRRVLGMDNLKTLKTLDHLGRVVSYPEAEALYRQTLEIRRRLLGPEHPDTLASMRGLAEAYYRQDKYPQAEKWQRLAVEVSRRVLGPEHPDTLKSMRGLARVYLDLGPPVQAEALFSQTVEIERRVLGPEHPETLSSMTGLALVYNTLGKYAQAETLDSEILETKCRVLGPEHPDTLASMNNLADTYGDQGKYVEAEALYSRAVEISRRVLGPEHPNTLTFVLNLAETYDALGNYPQAGALYDQTLEIRRRVLGPEDPWTLYTLSYVAYLHQRRGNYALAETYYAQILAGRRHALGPEHPRTLEAMADLALAYESQSKFVEGEPLARKAAEVYRKKEPDNWQVFRAESLVGASLAGQRKFAEAEPLLLEGYQGMLARKARMPALDHYHLNLAREWVVQLYQAWGKPGKAAEWRKD